MNVVPESPGVSPVECAELRRLERVAGGACSKHKRKAAADADDLGPKIKTARVCAGCPVPVPVLVTGGATGADAVWATSARRAGYDVLVTSFAGHTACVPDGAHVRLLSVAEAATVDPVLQVVAGVLGRSVGRSLYVRNLLRRNIALALDVDALLAVTSGVVTSGRLPGGTAWACTAFLLDRDRDRDRGGLYIYDEDARGWVSVTLGASPPCVETSPVDVATVRHVLYTTARVGAIGSRRMSHVGGAAIAALFAPACHTGAPGSEASCPCV